MTDAVRQWFQKVRLDSACGTVKHERFAAPHYVTADPELGIDKGPANPVDEFAALSPVDRTAVWLALDQGQRNGLWTQLKARRQLSLLAEGGIS